MRQTRLLAVVVVLLPFQVEAVPITFDFGGTITSTTNNFFNGANEFPAAVVGEMFSGHVTFDSANFTRSDCSVCSSSTYTYADTAPFGMTIEVAFGGFSISTNTSFDPTLFLFGAGGHSRISIANDRPIGSILSDNYNFISQTVLPSGNFSGAYTTGLVESPIAFLGLAFATGLTGDTSVLSGTDLPLVPPDISLFETRSFSILGGFPNVFVRGEVDYLTLRSANAVPEPSVLLLLALGLSILAIMRRSIRIRSNA